MIVMSLFAMWLNMTRRWLIWFLFISTVGFSEGLADRLLFEIDLQSYSQSQMESYLLCKDVLSGNNIIREVTSANWDQLLEEYKNDMIIHQEALRLGSFEASARVLDKALEVFQDFQATNDTAKVHIGRLGGKASTIRRTVDIAIRVESFRRSKKRQTAVINNRAETSLVRGTAIPEWQDELTQRAVVRFYEGASSYQAIRMEL